MDYYVSPNGDDNNQGTLQSPWKTIGKANQVLVAGDTVFIRGGLYSGAENVISPSNSGQNNAYITYRSYEGEVATLNGAGVSMNTRSYIIIDGIKIQNVGYFVFIDYCDNIIIMNCEMQNGTKWTSMCWENSTYCQLLNCYIHDCHADNVGLRTCEYCLVEGNTIEGGDASTHACLLTRNYTRYCVFRNNILFDGGDDNADVVRGGDHCLFENNIFRDTPGAGIKVQDGFHHIFRKNIMYRDGSYGTGGYINSSSWEDVYNNMWYHNSVYDCGKWSKCNIHKTQEECENIYDPPNGCIWDDDVSPPICRGEDMDACYRVVIFKNTVRNWRNNVVKNNIFYKGDRQTVYMDAVPGWGHLLHDNLFDNNIIFESVSSKPIRYKGTFYTVAESQTNLPNTFRNNIAANPMFTNPDNGDLTLQTGSPAIMTAAPLTKTAGSGSGTQITLEDARYFCDGYGIVDGDRIQIGSNEVMITSVNYDTNVIIVDQTISWSNGDPVILPGYYDIGAIQSGVEPLFCSNPSGTHGATICGNPAYGQDPTHQYQCIDGVWTDLGYSPSCDLAEPCSNPSGTHGATICGNPAHGQDPTHQYECIDGVWTDMGYSAVCDVSQPCVNPSGTHGATICGNPDYGQDPTHQYECIDGVWTDMGYSAVCDVSQPCVNPSGTHGATICGNPAYGQDPTHQYECIDGVWTDMGYSSTCGGGGSPNLAIVAIFITLGMGIGAVIIKQ